MPPPRFEALVDVRTAAEASSDELHKHLIADGFERTGNGVGVGDVDGPLPDQCPNLAPGWTPGAIEYLQVVEVHVQQA